MTKKTVLIIISGLAVVGLGSIGFYIYQKKQSSGSVAGADNSTPNPTPTSGGGGYSGGSKSGGGTGATTTSNDVLTNLGKGAAKKPDGTVIVMLGKNNEYQADFYTNGRFQLHPTDIKNLTKSSQLVKGSYKNGGRTLIPDGGNTVTSGSVWTNLGTLMSRM